MLAERMRTRANGRARRPRLVTPLFLLVMLSTWAYFTAVGTLQPTLPLFVKGPLNGTEVQVGLAISFFAVAAVLTRPFLGSVGDRRGRRVLIVAGAGIVSLATLGYLVSESLWVLLIFRLITGAGEAAFYVGAASVINDLAPDERRGEALSYFSLALYAGLVVGPVLGETILGDDNFTAVWLVAALAAGLAALAGLPVTETRPEEERAASGDARRIIHPAGLLPGMLLSASIWGLASFVTFIPLYAREVGLDGSRMVFVSYSMIIILLRLFGARIPDRLGAPRSAKLALGIQAVGLAVIGLWATPVGLFAGTAVFAIGHSLAFPALMTIAMRNAPPKERGAVVGTFTAFFDLSFGLGAVSSGVIAALLGYRGAFVAAGLVALAGFLTLVFRARRNNPRDVAAASMVEG